MDKYRVWGIDEITKPEIFRVCPLSQYGTFTAIAELFQYDREADVLYVSFGRSKHVTGVELTDNILLRLDTGKATEEPPRAVGLTFIGFAWMMEHYRDRPLTISLEALRNLPEDLWQAVLAVLTSPPVSDFLSCD